MDTELIKGTLTLLILSLLSRKPMYGYEIVATVKEETGGAFEWKAGSLYPSLHKLENEGLVSAEWEGEAGTRRRKYYHITDAGRAALGEKNESWRQVSQAVNQILENSDERDE
jgi:PadR family transcriptional regulator